ncbi:hypothetical protein [Raoultibacter phocaeensis]|uniref:hypothetical protein n=1 Tax=Raoultibacter phocaeensis TaxID=2479841 RepID=UPI001119B999|nr:hypothetical protein [Raoultibacter phocaeensis]
MAVAGAIRPSTVGIAGGVFLEKVKPEYCAEGFEPVPDGNGGCIVCDHAATETRNAVAASCSEKGYTGDTVCATCGKVLLGGEDVPMADHVYSWIVEKEPSAVQSGLRVEVCERCGNRGVAVEIPATGASESEVPESSEPDTLTDPTPHPIEAPSPEPKRSSVAPLTGDANAAAFGLGCVLLAGVCLLAGKLAVLRRRMHYSQSSE